MDKRAALPLAPQPPAAATPSAQPRAEEGGRRRRGSVRAAPGTRSAGRALLVLLVLGIAASVLYMGPIYPSSVQQLHLHLKLPLAEPVVMTRGGDAALGADSEPASAEAHVVLQAGDVQPRAASEADTLSFDVCGGFATQRVALVSGIVLAAELGRTVALPHLLLDSSTQHSDSNDFSSSVPFGQLYDLDFFINHMRVHGVRVSEEVPPAASTVAVRLNQRFDYMTALATTYAPHQHLKVECPVSKVPADLMVKHEKLVFAALSALQPAQPLRDVIDSIESKLQDLGDSNAYNVLHLRVEEDWIAHCLQWEGISDGVVRDNCLNNTATVGDRLALLRVDRQVPLLIAASWSRVNESLVESAMRSLEAEEYEVVLRDDVLGEGEKLPILSSEDSALIDYYLALRSKQFVGNSVSVFSALLIMERWHAGRYASYYNAGNIPLEALLPLYPFPWVFTFNDWSSGTEYDQMVKAAVTSAIDVARMKAFCMFSGSEDSVLYQWFVTKGVTIIRHDPAWKEPLIREGGRYRDHHAKAFSHLYKTDGALVGAFQRIDIPILRELDQYNYVLFSDCDVYFRRHMKLADWGTPLPTAIGMGYERYETFPYNDGVMLWNMPHMRHTNEDFVSWIFSQSNGLYFDGFGPLDQGAFNQFYEKDVRGKPISKNFNSMIHQQFQPEAHLVHIHGPKPNHYLEWLQTGVCQFHDLCQIGLANGVCEAMDEYIKLAPDWEVIQKLHQLCQDGTAATYVKEVQKKQAAQYAARKEVAQRAAAAQRAASQRSTSKTKPKKSAASRRKRGNRNTGTSGLQRMVGPGSNQ